ncbi:site-specific DNA-methyltransferase [Knoellia locipacati]|uniref:DNA methylase N-4 n=1 Tax=Knoellia locipacati TaxID=882824 RepID=A0A512SZH9_9MICO|nr:site-specific DNA-methyltransferase [Knoellia locipacati]GEQ13319.1 DNA methylase N-4 [Knoellia locipacati]
MEKLRMTSSDVTANNTAKIAELFPGVMTEAVDPEGNTVRAVDFDLLRQELSDHLVEGPQERYQLDWPGKRASAFAANAPIAKTLRPIRKESVDFDATKNLFIEGDNLDALKLLQESYLSKVKVIYIDPPYNTGHDFVYNDDFGETVADYLAKSGQSNDEGSRLITNLETSGRFHSDWLSFMYPRLRLARNLLSDDGVIFVSISEHEVDNLRKLMDAVFGEANFIGQIAVSKGTTTGQDASHIGSSIDFLLVAARNRNSYVPNGLPLDDKDVARFREADERGRFSTLQFRKTGSNDRREDRPSMYYAVTAPDGTAVYPVGPGGYESRWRAGRDQYDRWVAEDMIVWNSDLSGIWKPYVKYYLEGRTKQVSNYWDDIEGNKKATMVVKDLLGAGIFSNPKPVGLLRKILHIATDSDSLVLDFFAGSGTTAHAVMELNATDGGRRSFIQVQLAEKVPAGSAAAKAGYSNIAEIAKERIRRAGTSIRDGAGMIGDQLDVGFRAVRVDTTNMADVLRVPDETDQQSLEGLGSSVKQGRTGEDLLFQVLLDWGLEITAPIVSETVEEHEVFLVDGGALVACFSKRISPELVRDLAKRQPLRAVFRDAGFASDDARINAEQIFKEISPSSDVKVI